MPMTSREYREHLHARRTHPHHFSQTASQAHESFHSLYLTLIPFLIAEYWTELRFETLPSGIVFPTGYILFWAFYYTYYRPGVLESQLSRPGKWDLLSIPTILMGTVIWFVKVVVVEFTDVVLTSLLKKKKKAPAAQVRSQPLRAVPNPKAPEGPPPLPREVENALAVLGLRDCRDWRVIQKRYRELAKQFHPDLNPELTTAGNRFMIYDGAYRRLISVKDKYFHL